MGAAARAVRDGAGGAGFAVAFCGADVAGGAAGDSGASEGSVFGRGSGFEQRDVCGAGGGAGVSNFLPDGDGCEAGALGGVDTCAGYAAVFVFGVVFFRSRWWRCCSWLRR